jgi:predicted transcriptional regulator
MSVTQGIKLDETTHKRLKALGEIRHRTPHWLMCAAIEDYLEREEAYEREKHEDMERWEQYQLTAKAIPQEIVTEWLSNLAQGKATPCPK